MTPENPCPPLRDLALVSFEIGHACHEHLQGRGLGRLEMAADNTDALIRAQLEGGYHQVGTTRMAAAARDGVVDSALRVHGVKNLSVVSSSAFVTASQANSTFMIVVFAVRLASDVHAALALNT